MLTLFVDASFSHQRMRGGWGAWAIHDSWNRGKTFGDRMVASNSGEAEVVAIAKAIEWLQSKGLWLNDVVMIQSDSHHALSAIIGNCTGVRVNNHSKDSVAFSKKSPSLSPREKNAVRIIEQATFGRQLYLRHIKGHTGKKEGRNWVNMTCDRIAKKHMRAA